MRREGVELLHCYIIKKIDKTLGKYVILSITTGFPYLCHCICQYATSVSTGLLAKIKNV